MHVLCYWAIILRHGSMAEVNFILTDPLYKNRGLFPKGGVECWFSPIIEKVTFYGCNFETGMGQLQGIIYVIYVSHTPQGMLARLPPTFAIKMFYSKQVFQQVLKMNYWKHFSTLVLHRKLKEQVALLWEAISPDFCTDSCFKPILSWGFLVLCLPREEKFCRGISYP